MGENLALFFGGNFLSCALYYTAMGALLGGFVTAGLIATIARK